MNRDIRFRVWNSKEKKFFYQPDCGRLDSTLEYWELHKHVEWPQQYIGLKDSSGKEIYEGDLLIDKNQLFAGIWYEVVFDKGWFVAEYEDVKGRPHRKDIAETEFLIIGNKFENEDLWKRI